MPRNWSRSTSVEPACSGSKESFVFSSPVEWSHSKDELSFLTEKTLYDEYPCTAFPAMFLDWLELYSSPWHIIYIALLYVSIASFVVFPQDLSVCWLYVLIYQLFVWNRPSRVIRHNIWNLPYLDQRGRTQNIEMCSHQTFVFI